MTVFSILLFGWIASVQIVLTGNSSDFRLTEDGLPTEANWQALAASILSLSTQPIREAVIFQWLLYLAMILSPESGTPPQLAQKFLECLPDDDSLRKLWRERGNDITQLRKEAIQPLQLGANEQIIMSGRIYGDTPHPINVITGWSDAP